MPQKNIMKDLPKKQNSLMDFLPFLSVILLFLPFLLQVDSSWSGMMIYTTTLEVIPLLIVSLVINAIAVWTGASLSLKESCLVSLVANACSFGLGALTSVAVSILTFCAFLIQLWFCGEGPNADQCFPSAVNYFIIFLLLGTAFIISYLLGLGGVALLYRKISIRRVWVPLLIGSILTAFIVCVVTGFSGEL